MQKKKKIPFQWHFKTWLKKWLKLFISEVEFAKHVWTHVFTWNFVHGNFTAIYKLGYIEWNKWKMWQSWINCNFLMIKIFGYIQHVL